MLSGCLASFLQTPSLPLVFATLISPVLCLHFCVQHFFASLIFPVRIFPALCWLLCVHSPSCISPRRHLKPYIENSLSIRDTVSGEADIKALGLEKNVQNAHP